MTEMRVMAEPELETVLGWAAAEGWNPGLQDAEAFYRSDSEGYFVSLHHGEIVAAISVVNHCESMAFLGLYLCRPDHRGKGFGFSLWQHALRHAGDRTIGLDGVPDQQSNYRKSGFEAQGGTSRYGGVVTFQPADDVRIASASDLEVIASIDRTMIGYERNRFLSSWLEQRTARHTFVLDQGGEVKGWITFRRCVQGWKIGPLQSPDIGSAARLLHAIASPFGDAPVFIDVAEEQTELAAYCQELGMSVSFSTARMYKGTAPLIGAGIQSVATLELG